jgi:uncharacterized membrane protein YgcG
MQDIDLGFPLLNGGEEEGLNDAGIETFEGDIGDYIARECGQNTSDASPGGRVELHFEIRQMSASDLPCIERLKGVFEQCRDYWNTDRKAVAFFTTGLSWLEKGIFPTLKIGDYGTTGLTGEDSDRTSKWFGLVRSKGACNKVEGSAGSFGIGKYAPFAASALRTVYYYTRTKDNDAFQGISRLVTHCNDEMQQTQATGYIGQYEVDGSGYKYSSIRDRSLIPAHFLRNEDQLGTDIYIPVYRALDNWKEGLIVSALNNFWPAICLGKILFKIGDKTIDKSNIDSCIEEYRMHPELKAYRYFRAYRNGSIFSEKLSHVGDSELRLVIDNQRESNPIAVARKTGMIIETWGHFRSRKPICGIYICDDLLGNEKLRQLEPPRHDKWDKNRGQNGKEILSTIREWVRSCIEKLIPADTSESFDLDVLSKFVPDNSEEDKGEEPFDRDDAPENRDGFEPSPAQPQKNITKAVVPPAGTPVDEEGQDVEVSGEGEGDSGGCGEGEGKGGGDHGGGGGEGKGKGGTGGAASSTSSVRVLRLRYTFNDSDASYRMIVRSQVTFEGDISFGAECDDGTIEPVDISKALWNGHEVTLKNGRRSFAAKIQPDAREIFVVSFEQNEKMSLRIVQ